VSLDVGKKTDKVAEDWTAGGNEFKITDAATGNERRPTVVRRYAGTCSSWDADERRRWRYGFRSHKISLWESSGQLYITQREREREREGRI